jgi:hypothetical protein
MPDKKSAPKSAPPGRPFQQGIDSRRGRGPKKGAANAGRPASAVRDAARLAFAERLHVLKAIADGEPVHKVEIPGKEGVTVMKVSASPGDRIRALEVLAKIGLPAQIESADGKPLLLVGAVPT